MQADSVTKDYSAQGDAMPMTDERVKEIALLVEKRASFRACLQREDGDAERALAACEEVVLEVLKGRGPFTEEEYESSTANIEEVTHLPHDEVKEFISILHQRAQGKLQSIQDSKKLTVYVGGPCPKCGAGALAYVHYGWGECSACHESFRLD